MPPPPVRKQKAREAEEKKRKALLERMMAAHRNTARPAPEKAVIEPKPGVCEPTPTAVPIVQPQVPRYGAANIPLYREGEQLASAPPPSVVDLVNLYLEVAQKRSRHIVMVWPVAPRTLLTIHTLATFERWKAGDKQGVRGLIYPAKSNVFHVLNHLHLDRQQVLALASDLATAQIPIVRNLTEKDPFLMALGSIQADPNEPFNPTIGDLLPRFYAGVGFRRWTSCASTLLEHISVRVRRRAHKQSLRANCDDIGDPNKAPDAMFALDGRLSNEELRKALAMLGRCGSPEVVLVNATRAVRKSAYGWEKHLTRFCMLLEEVFPRNKRPGILIVTDEPHAAFQLRTQLQDFNKKQRCWEGNNEYRIDAVCNGVAGDGLMEPGVTEPEHPVPREFDVEVVDAEANQVIRKLYRIANNIGRADAQPVLDAAGYLSRLAALPCGVSTLNEWLSLSTTSDYARRAFSWLTFHAELTMFAHQGKCGNEIANIKECLALGTKLFENYQRATPFAERLASLLGYFVVTKKKQVAIVYTSAIYRRLSEKFLADYAHFPDGEAFSAFADRVTFILSSQLEDCLDNLESRQLIFSGLDDESLRLLMLDNRIEKHTCILLTTRGGQYLKGTLTSLVNDVNFPAFKPLKPRMESILRNLKKLPDDNSILSLGDFVLPTFRSELAIDPSEDAVSADDPEACKIALENGQILYRRPTHHVYLYDPANEAATARGFRSAQVQSLVPGDKLFVMSQELRELVESALKEAGVPIAHDKSFENELREYHEEVLRRLETRFPRRVRAEQVRQLRAHIVSHLEQKNPMLAKDFPGLAAVSHWVNLGGSADTPFDQLQPQAPQKEAHFSLLAQTLGFSKLETAYLWRRVIMPIRNARRQDGRHVSDLYAHMLLQPESVMLNGGIPRATIKLLFSKARENVVVVESIELPLEAMENEYPRFESKSGAGVHHTERSRGGLVAQHDLRAHQRRG